MNALAVDGSTQTGTQVMAALVPAESRRMPSLDGIRALSIALVFAWHLCGTRGFLSSSYTKLFDFGNLGVRIFFVISGYLITSLLMKERSRQGKISLRLFYARRAVRIFPAAYACIAALSVCSLLGFFYLNAADIWRAATYTTNLWPYTVRSWQLGHMWSLSVEEQFYLIWPALFAFVRPRNAKWAAFALFLLGICFRLFAWRFLLPMPIYVSTIDWFPALADSLAAGCLLATLEEWLMAQSWYRTLQKPHWSLMIFVALSFLVIFEWRRSLMLVFGVGVLNLGIAFFIHRSVVQYKGVVGCFLNWKPLKFIGALSYSLYLWQQPFLNKASQSWVCAFPQNVFFAVGVALLSYYLIEKPLLNFRRHLHNESA